MPRSIRLAAAPLLIASLACAGATTDPSARPAGGDRVIDAPTGGTVTLSVGETARFDAGEFAVTFRRVVQDSRCPATVVCVWAGDGAVQLWLKRGSRSAAATVHTLDGPRATELDGYTVELIELQPYPVASPIEAEAYLVTLGVTRAAGTAR